MNLRVTHTESVRTKAPNWSTKMLNELGPLWEVKPDLNLGNLKDSAEHADVGPLCAFEATQNNPPVKSEL